MKFLELKKNDRFFTTRHLLIQLGDDDKVIQYIVCSNYNGKDWDSGHYFENITDAVSFYEMHPQINPHRLSEIASLLKDGIIEDDYDSAMEYFRDTLQLTEEECDYFDIDYDEMMGDEI